MAALQLGRWDPNATLYALFYFAEASYSGRLDALARSSPSSHSFLRTGSDGGDADVNSVGIPLLAYRAWTGRILRCGEVLSSPKIEHAKFIVCISDFCRSQLMRIAAPEHWDKMHVVRLGVDPDVFFPLRRDFSAGSASRKLFAWADWFRRKASLSFCAPARSFSPGAALRVRLVGDGPDPNICGDSRSVKVSQWSLKAREPR